MEVDFDIDLEYENDKIKSFLQDKLHEIKKSNKELLEMIGKRKEDFSNSFKTGNSLKETNSIKLIHCWKTFYNNKCAFGFKLCNCSDTAVEIYKIFLKSDYSVCLDFHTYIFTDDYKLKVLSEHTDINTCVYIVLVTNIPQFTNNLCCTINGIIFLKQHNTDFIINFPCMKITSLDLTNNELSDIILQSEGDYHFLTVKACSLKVDLAMILPEDLTTNVDTLFEIHCFLTSIYLTKSLNRYFAANKICPTFDNSLIEIHNSSNDQNHITVYTKNDESLIAFLHHLHQNIPGVVLIPKSCFDKYDIYRIFKKFNVHDEISTFKTCIKKEIAVVHSYKQYLDSARKDCVVCLHLRKKLLAAEKDTDLSYLRITANM